MLNIHLQGVRSAAWSYRSRRPGYLPVLGLFTAVVLLAGCGVGPQPAPTADIPTAGPGPTTTGVEATATPAPAAATIAPTPTTQSAGPAVAPIVTGTTITSDSPVPTPVLAATQPSTFWGYTHQQPDGNRLVRGRGNLPGRPPVDIPLAGEPAWVVAAPAGDGGSVWVVALSDGRTQAFRVRAGVHDETLVEPVPLTPSQLPPGMPPLLKLDDETVALPAAPTDAASTQTHPIFLPATKQMVSVQAGGELLFWNQEQTDFTRLAVNALPDARILMDESGRLLLLTGPTSRYGHGVLGDSLEAAGITLIETQPEPRVVTTISIPEPAVVEGIAPIWTDLNGDGQREIIVTLSNSAQGAQLVVFNEAGQQLASGPAIGQGQRWRHQLAAAPFGPNGETELADVLTPHIGGTVEFYQLDGDRLRIVAQLPGYTSHVIGTRNLDMAVAGDFDGDGRVELLLPNQRRTELGAVQRTADGAGVVWRLPVEGLVTTNLAALSLADGRLVVGAGRDDGVLRLWGP